MYMLRSGDTAPAGFRTDTFTIEPLSASNAELDYESYMASPDVIRVHSDGRWPIDGFTLAEDIAMAARHDIDHRAGRSFAFVLLTPSRDRALGCVYLNPLHAYLTQVGASESTLASVPSVSAMVTFWIRQDSQHTDLPRMVAAEVNGWILDDWPLDTHVFRVLPAEISSRSALEGIGCPRVDLDLPAEPRPYLWFAPAGHAFTAS